MEDAEVLILAPVGRDGSTAAEIFSRIGINATVCPDYKVLVSSIGARCLAIVAAEEGLFGMDLADLTRWVQNQPPWSDLPFIVLTSHLAHRRIAEWRTQLVAALGNVTLLERPVQMITLVSSIQSAVRARKRQYELEKLLSELELGNERFRLIVENATDYAILMTNPKDIITAWLPGAAAVFGWSEKEMLGKPAASIFTPEDRLHGIPEQEISRARAEGEAPNIRWHATKDGGRVFLDGKTVVLRHGDNAVRGFLKIGKDVTERQRNEERQAVLLAELQHRVRNVLAVVAALVKRSDSGGTKQEYCERLSGRIAAMARTQALLTRGAGVGVDLESTIRDELAAQSADDLRVWVKGPKVVLAPKAAEVLTLAIHELATNAAKYGAIRAPTGRISVQWRCERQDNEIWLEFDWRETGVETAPQGAPRKGFGTELITKRVPYELQGRGAVDINADGIQCRIGFPLKIGESILQTGAPLSGLVAEKTLS